MFGTKLNSSHVLLSTFMYGSAYVFDDCFYVYIYIYILVSRMINLVIAF